MIDFEWFMAWEQSGNRNQHRHNNTMTNTARKKPFGIGRLSFIFCTVLLVAILFNAGSIAVFVGIPELSIALGLGSLTLWLFCVVPARMINGRISLWSLLVLLVPVGNLLLLVALCLRKPRLADSLEAVPIAAE